MQVNGSLLDSCVKPKTKRATISNIARGNDHECSKDFSTKCLLRYWQEPVLLKNCFNRFIYLDRKIK